MSSGPARSDTATWRAHPPRARRAVPADLALLATLGESEEIHRRRLQVGERTLGCFILSSADPIGYAVVDFEPPPWSDPTLAHPCIEAMVLPARAAGLAGHLLHALEREASQRGFRRLHARVGPGGLPVDLRLLAACGYQIMTQEFTEETALSLVKVLR